MVKINVCLLQVFDDKNENLSHFRYQCRLSRGTFYSDGCPLNMGSTVLFSIS